MKDISGRELKPGQFVVYSQPSGRSNSCLAFGYITQMREKTGKIWLNDAHYDGELMKFKPWDAPEGVLEQDKTISNYFSYRFYILRDV